MGSVGAHPFFKYVQPDQPNADLVRLAKDAAIGGVENNWHHDLTRHTRHTRPSFGVVLRAVEVPPEGGDTLRADMEDAYELLPADIRARIDHLEAEHDWIHAFGRRMSDEEIAAVRDEYPAVRHPVVRVTPRPAGAACSSTSPSPATSSGPAAESDGLLRLLYRHVQPPEFQVRLRWLPDTVVFWDNRSCQHYAASDYHPQRRVMERMSIGGDTPTGPV